MTFLILFPRLLQLKVSWKRIQDFIADIPANIKENYFEGIESNNSMINSIRAESLYYEYKEGFAVGPIDIELKKGEVLFIIGGNGSGKTTLAKLLTGLYSPQKGKLYINGRDMDSGDIGEYYSTVFNPFYLFQKLYVGETTYDIEEINEYLKILELDHKVNIKDNAFSTISLSGGQRKRLALLQCHIEDKPIYLFDEWAADQDPEYRRFFYRELIPRMKEKGKIVIAISHDDHYFDVADKILKLNVGKIEYLKHPISVSTSFIQDRRATN